MLIFNQIKQSDCFQVNKICAACIFLCLWSDAVLAQELSNETAQTTLLDAVTVSATRTKNSNFEVPASVTTIDRKQIDSLQAETLSTVLRTVPNVNYAGGPRAAAQSPSIRGLQGPRVILSVDGARRNNEGGVHTPLLLDPDFVKSVDIVRGPVSAAYGSGGLGGVMAFETISASDFISKQDAGGRLKTGYRSASGELSANLTGAKRTNAFDFLASATYRNHNTIHTAASGQHKSYPNDGDLKTGLFKVGYDINSVNRLEASYQIFDDKVVGPTNPGGNLLFPYSQELDRKQTQYTGSWSFKDESSRLFDGKLSLYQTSFKLNGVSRSIPPQADTSAETKTWGVSLQNSSRFDTGEALAHRLTYGVDFYRDTSVNTSQGQPNTVLPDGRAQSMGVFLQNEISLFDHWTVIGALRHDSYKLSSPNQSSSTSSRLSPKLALKYQPWEAFGIFTSYGEAFRAPTVTEMFGNLNTNRALFNFRSNSTLKPETSKTHELGATLSFDNILFAKDKIRLKTTFFSEDVQDMINQQVVGTFVRQAPFNGVGLVFQRQNIAIAERHGAELEFAYTTKNLVFGLGYSRLRSQDSLSRAHLYAPPDKLSLGIQYQISPNWKFHYIGEFNRAQDYDSTILRRRAGYAVHGLGASFEKKLIRIDFSVSNLLDKSYATYQQSLAETFSYEQGRSLNLTFTTRF